MADMDRCSLYQPDISVNASARIPARRVGRVVETNGKDVLFSVFEVRRQVEFERCITVGPGTNELAVEPDGGVGHCAVNVQIEFPSLFVRGHVEMFSIPGDTPPRKLARFAWIILIERTFDAPIVRQI